MTNQVEQVLAIVLMMLIFWLIPRQDRAIAGGIDEAKEPEDIGQMMVAIDRLDMVVVEVPRGWKSVDDIDAAEVIYEPVSAGNQIDELFDCAWAGGTKTYAGLIEYARSSTGKGTSKTRVKAWKAKRGLLDE